jgi:methylenetetrahydrofolate--tRNA-(uracil-5-)-methyltransferase
MVKDSKELRELAANWDVTVVGAGLAGSECAFQLASYGYKVGLLEMRGAHQTPAHKSDRAAELVCSNSFGSQTPGTAPHQLKWEAQRLNSFILSQAQIYQIPAGQALAVDRERFSNSVHQALLMHPNIDFVTYRLTCLEELPRPAVLATGPLTDLELAKSLQKHFGDEFLYFFDAIAPVISTDSINFNIAWRQSRYNKGGDDYINCPLNKDQYFQLIDEISKARKIEPKHFDETPFFEGCMPIEAMVERGPQTLRFGPLKPVGLKPPGSEKEPYAVVQLRQDNREATAYNMVGFQTRMAYGEQVRVFRMIPGLEDAEFLKLGSIHRNLYINSPKRLNKNLSSQNDPSLFFAGQITGVEGYFESTCIGLLVARFVDAHIKNQEVFFPPRESALGSLLNAITDPIRAQNFQPTNINFGLLPPHQQSIDDERKKIPKEERRAQQIEIARKSFLNWLDVSFTNKNLIDLLNDQGH